MDGDLRLAFAGLRGRDPYELFKGLRTPCYLIDEAALIHNLDILKRLSERTGAGVLLAQKAFSNYDFYPLMSKYLGGTEASGLYEARLGYMRMPGREVHVFAAAYREDEFAEILKYADHIVFNSPPQLERFGAMALKAGKSLGLRINPECSTQGGHAIYDPCAPGSRLGTTRETWDRLMTSELISMLDGIHFHTLCEQDSDALETTLAAVGDKFGDVLCGMKWLNMGGGHHITREGYDLGRLERCIRYAAEKWDLRVYLEPGEAAALNAGYFVTRVLDITDNNGICTAITDASAACHMPDVLEMPYTPPLYGAAISSDNDTAGYRYTLAGPTCLAGDVIGTYTFAAPLKVGDMLIFGDMAIYTTCKNNTFNGMRLPDILKLAADGSLSLIREFGYGDFFGRLGSGRNCCQDS